MLPLSDRILLKLRTSSSTARQLSTALEVDITKVHHILRALETQGAVEEWEVPREGSQWRLAPGVRVNHWPERVEIAGARPPSNAVSHSGCRAVSPRGRPCRLAAARDGLCFLHGPKGTDA